MTCGAAQELFGLDVDDRLEPVRRAALEQHLAGCAGCRAERERWVRTSRALRAGGPTPIPEDLPARCWRAALRAEPRSPSLAAWFVAAARPAALAGAAAALLVWAVAERTAPAQSATEPAVTDPMELAVHLWTAVEVPGDGL